MKWLKVVSFVLTVDTLVVHKIKMISIITTSYNYSEYISETIKSVLAQTYSDWELIIVDDASQDNSVEIIKSFCNDTRIKLICHEKNRGLKEAIKTGLKEAKGQWIAFLESDDSFCVDTLQKRIEQCPNDVNIIFNAVNLIGEPDWIDATKNQIKKNEKFLAKHEFPKNILNFFVDKNPILTLSSIMIKKELLTDDIFNAPIDSLFDWWLYIQLAYNNKMYYLPQKLTNWRIHSNSYIKKPHKPYFCMVNVLAYINLFKQKPSLNLIFLIIQSFFKMSITRLKVYMIGFIRKFKSFLGLKTKKSPIFD